MIVKLTPVRQNVIRIFKRALDRAHARHAAKCRKVSLLDPKLWKSVDCGRDIDRLIGYIGSTPGGISFNNLPDNDIRSLLAVLVRFCYTGDKQMRQLEKGILDDIRSHAAEYELMAQMPPVKREYNRRGPRTLVERRADAVAEKVREWERKLKVAKTKLAAYQKKQKYYAKKGAAV
jgi:hypothetical protein